MDYMKKFLAYNRKLLRAFERINLLMAKQKFDEAEKLVDEFGEMVNKLVEDYEHDIIK